MPHKPGIPPIGSLTEGRPATRRGFLITCGAGVLAAGLAGLSRWSGRSRAAIDELPGDLKFARRTSWALGSEISMLALHESPVVGERALDAAFAEIARVERVMSIYLSASEVSRLNSEGFVRDPDPYLVEVLKAAGEVSSQTGGAFDVSVQPLWNLYSAAAKQGALPTPAAIEEARRLIDWKAISISAQEIRLLSPHMAITLNGIAQGFAADRAMEALQRCGIHHALVNAGEVRPLGKRASGDAWVVGIQHPRQKNSYIGLAGLEGRCLSTSGDYESAFTPDFSSNHIFDPGTGRSPGAFASVTVAAPDATTADALSTAIFVLGPEKGMAVAGKFPDTDLFFVLKDERTMATPSFPWCSGSAANSTPVS